MEELNEVYTAEAVANVSDEVLANVVNGGVGYNMVKDILVKPLPVTKLLRVVNVPTKTDEVDEEGQPIMEMKQEEVEVDSSFRTGIVIALPPSGVPEGINVGTKVVYPNKYAMEFDLFKDSVLIKHYDIVATI